MICSVIKVKLKEILAEKKKTLYALAQETGITYPTLHRISKGKAESMSFEVLEKLCRNLKCTPNDILALEE